MARYCAYRGRQIRAVSSHHVQYSDDSGMKVLEVPAHLEEIADGVLMERFVVRQGQLIDTAARVEPSRLRVALVGVYKERCGISTYAEALWPHLIAGVAEARIFCEEGTVERSPDWFADEDLKKTMLVPSWKRGQPLMRLVNEIKQFDPDVVMIQHEYGLFPDARHWLAFLSALRDYKVFVTLHSVFHHKDKTICEAAVPNIIVHTELARDVLKNEKKVPGDVHVIPHGCHSFNSGEKYWNLYRSKHTFMQFGFGFRYKGFESCIRAVAELRQTLPDVFFTALFSESPHAKVQHDAYAQDLHELVDELGVQENVAIVRGFQSDETLGSYLRTNQAAVFPYCAAPDHTVFGCSGAARIAMSHGIPIVASTEPHFHDLQGVAPRVSDVAGIVQALTGLFSSADERKAQLGRQAEFLRVNSWENVARRHLELL